MCGAGANRKNMEVTERGALRSCPSLEMQCLCVFFSNVCVVAGLLRRNVLLLVIAFLSMKGGGFWRGLSVRSQLLLLNENDTLNHCTETAELARGQLRSIPGAKENWCTVGLEACDGLWFSSNGDDVHRLSHSNRDTRGYGIEAPIHCNNGPGVDRWGDAEKQVMVLVEQRVLSIQCTVEQPKNTDQTDNIDYSTILLQG
mmetsp:Transcript_18162/g.20879  ORF Transcript_18162/g.20879 Transcript_18162/m.20879 type:complete len:200 (+) Transcript_18162:48-647(+)